LLQIFFPLKNTEVAFDDLPVPGATVSISKHILDLLLDLHKKDINT